MPRAAWRTTWFRHARSRRTESSGPAASRRDSSRIKFPASRKQRFTESNLLGEKAA